MSQRGHVSFDADYPTDHDGESPPGEELCDAIVDGLRRRGVQCEPPVASDYAYSFEAATDAGRGLVMVGYVGDEDGREWLVFVEPAKAGGLFRRARSDVSAVVRALHVVISDDIGATPQWFTEAEWNDPQFARGQPAPDA